MSSPGRPRRIVCRPHGARKQGWYLTFILGAFCVLWLTRDFGWHVVWQSAPFLLKGLAKSWILALASAGLGFLAAVPLAAARVYGPAGIRHLAVGVIELVRATPEMMIIFWAFFAMPLLTGNAVSSWFAAIAALTTISAIHLAEVIRGGLCSVSRHQWDAALATGLSHVQALLFVILPQALRNMLPAFLAQLAMLFKATSLVYVIGVVEFFRSVTIVNNAAVAPYALYTVLAGTYFACCWVLTAAVRRFDPRYPLAE